MLIALCNEVLATMPFERQCEFAAATGYDGLELAPFTLSTPEESWQTADAVRIRRVVESKGLVVTGLHWLLVTPQGLSMTHPDPVVRKRTREIISRLTTLCAELGGRVLIHGSPAQRQIFPGQSKDDALERLKDALGYAAECAARNGVVYCIEPLSRTQTGLINTVSEAAEIVHDIASTSLRTMIDCSSAGVEEKQPIPELIRQWMPTGLIAHIQLNDRNRRGPGQGADRFGPILQALKSSNYQGAVAVEPFDYVPDGPSCAARSIGYIRGLLEGQ
jgi:D-psicose/D-tagatose/L-ribulose 3-epimerase